MRSAIEMNKYNAIQYKIKRIRLSSYLRLSVLKAYLSTGKRRLVISYAKKIVILLGSFKSLTLFFLNDGSRWVGHRA